VIIAIRSTQFDRASSAVPALFAQALRCERPVNLTKLALSVIVALQRALLELATVAKELGGTCTLEALLVTLAVAAAPVGALLFGAIIAREVRVAFTCVTVADPIPRA
jgi:hypothetical protein